MGFFGRFGKTNKSSKELEGIYEKLALEAEGRKLADRAISYRNLGEHAKALFLLREAVDKYKYMPALTLFGNTLLVKGDVDAAIHWFEDILLHPMQGADYLILEWLGNLGSIYLYQKEDARKALAAFTKALHLPKPSELDEVAFAASLSLIHRDISVAYLALAEISLARDFATKRLEFDPSCYTAQKVFSMCQGRA